jgi:predicted flap endonuclease-1-like 5' DNA nuclease
MTEHERSDELIALEAARVQLEIALSRNQDWLAFRHGMDGSNRSVHEQALAANAVFRSWQLVSEAIETLRGGEATGDLARGLDRAEGGVVQDNEKSLAADSLTRIRGITPELAQRLAELGVSRFGEIAAWRSQDVRTISAALGLGREISRQNWIEQAALLDRRDHAEAAETAASARQEPAAVAPTIDLPDILAHIRSDAASRGGEVLAVSLDDENAASTVQAEAEAVQAPATVVGEPAPGSAIARSPIPIVEPSAHVNTDAAERTRGLAQARQASSKADTEPGAPPAAANPHEAGEATVTFLIRDDAPESPGETPRGSEPAPVAADSARTEPYVPPKSLPREADVMIVAPALADEGSVPGRKADGAIRRLLRALTGA